MVEAFCCASISESDAPASNIDKRRCIVLRWSSMTIVVLRQLSYIYSLEEESRTAARIAESWDIGCNTEHVRVMLYRNNAQ